MRNLINFIGESFVGSDADKCGMLVCKFFKPFFKGGLFAKSNKSKVINEDEANKMVELECKDELDIKRTVEQLNKTFESKLYVNVNSYSDDSINVVFKKENYASVKLLDNGFKLKLYNTAYTYWKDNYKK